MPVRSAIVPQRHNQGSDCHAAPQCTAQSLLDSRRTIQTVLMMLLLMNDFPGCPHVMLIQFINVSSSFPSRFRNRRRCSNPASVCSAPSCRRHVCCLTPIQSLVGSFSSFCMSGVLRSSLHQTPSVRCGMIFVLKCGIRMCSTSPGAVALPFEKKSVPRRTVTYPWFSEAQVVGTPTTDSPIRMFLISIPQHLSSYAPCLYASPTNTW